MNSTLSQRVLPKQKRAKETVELILATSIQLICEVGFDKFTTKLLAERAGILIRNVYRYFPNKLAIISALAERMSVLEAEYLDNFSILSNTKISLEDAIDSTAAAFINAAKNEPAYFHIRNALHGSPELMKLFDERSAQNLVNKLSKALSYRTSRLPAGKLKLISLVVIDTATALLNRCFIELYYSQNKQKSDLIINEMKSMACAYLSKYFT